MTVNQKITMETPFCPKHNLPMKESQSDINWVCWKGCSYYPDIIWHKTGRTVTGIVRLPIYEERVGGIPYESEPLIIGRKSVSVESDEYSLNQEFKQRE